MMTGTTPVWDPHFIETLEGSFSAVSRPLIPRNCACCSIFRDLQDLHSFAPLQTKNFGNMIKTLKIAAANLSTCFFVLKFQNELCRFRAELDEHLLGFQEITSM